MGLGALKLFSDFLSMSACDFRVLLEEHALGEQLCSLNLPQKGTSVQKAKLPRQGTAKGHLSVPTARERVV